MHLFTLGAAVVRGNGAHSLPACCTLNPAAEVLPRGPARNNRSAPVLPTATRKGFFFLNRSKPFFPNTAPQPDQRRLNERRSAQGQPGAHAQALQPLLSSRPPSARPPNPHFLTRGAACVGQ